MTKRNLRIWKRAYPHRQWMVILGFIFLPVGLVTFGELIVLYHNARLGFIELPFSINYSYLLPWILILAILAILGLGLLTVGICSMLIIPNKEIPVIRHLFIAIPVTILIVMFIFSALIMFFDSMIVFTEYWFDIDNKKEALKFIGWGMGGMVIALNGGVLDRRAGAQEKNNELVRKGNDDVRFQNVVTGLGNKKATVRIATFYRFYYLASKKGQKKSFKKDVFEILCSCLRSISNDTSNTTKNEHEDKERIFRSERIERQALCDVLFRGKFKGNKNKNQDLVSSKITADLKWADLTRLNLPNADLSGADLSGARLSGAVLWYADLSNAILLKTRFIKARLSGTNFSKAQLVDADFSDAIFNQTDFSDANLSRAIFSETTPLKTQLEKIHSIEKANFNGAKVGNRAISREDLPTNKGRYIAPWANDEFWAQVEKDEKNKV